MEKQLFWMHLGK